MLAKVLNQKQIQRAERQVHNNGPFLALFSFLEMVPLRYNTIFPFTSQPQNMET